MFKEILSTKHPVMLKTLVSSFNENYLSRNLRVKFENLVEKKIKKIEDGHTNNQALILNLFLINNVWHTTKIKKDRQLKRLEKILFLKITAEKDETKLGQIEKSIKTLEEKITQRLD